MSEVPAAALTVLSEEIPCAFCGYNLRGLAADGRCPECGSRIADSLRGNLLEFSDPAWLSRLRFGTSLKLWNIALFILVGFAFTVLVFAGVPPIVMAGASTIGAALGLWATFAITTQEPRIAFREDSVSLRILIRVSATLGFLGGLIQQGTAPTIVVGQQALSLSFAQEALLILGYVLSFGGVLAWWGELVYYRRFALRIPDDKLARSTRILLWAIPIMGVLVILGAILGGRLARNVGVTAGLAGQVPSLFPALLGLGVCVFGITALGFLFWYVRVLTMYKVAFTRALELAQKGQAAENPAGNPG